MDYVSRADAYLVPDNPSSLAVTDNGVSIDSNVATMSGVCHGIYRPSPDFDTRRTAGATKHGAAGLLTVAAVLGLAGCAAGPSMAQVEERFLIEYADALDYPVEIVDGNAVLEQLARTLASDAEAGACGDEGYFGTLEADVEYAFGVTCSIYYEGELTTERAEWVKLKVLERASEDTDAN